MAKNESSMSKAEIYREERKARIAKAAKQNAKSIEKRNSFSKIAKKVIAIVLVVAIAGGLAWKVVDGLGIIEKFATAVEIGDTKLSAAEYNYYYSAQHQQMAYYEQMYQSNYGYSIGYDTTVAPDEQNSTEKDADGNPITWAESFKTSAVNYAQSIIAYYNEAVEAGYELSEDEIAQINETIENYRTEAANSNYSLNAYLRESFGAGFNEKSFKKQLEMEIVAQNFSEDKADEFNNALSEEDVLKVYNENKKNYNYADVRYYSFAYKTLTANEGESKEALAERQKAENAKVDAEAKAVLDKITDDASFVAAVKEAKESKDTDLTTLSSNTSYSSLTASTSDKAADWAFDAARKAGDKTVIAGEKGAIVLYIVKPSYSMNSVDVRHCLVQFDSETDEVTDAQKEVAYTEAKNLLDEWLKGDKTEESFAAMAKENTDDTASAETGGLYEGIRITDNYVAEFEAWSFDDSRKAGDTGIIETDYGYHIMYFVKDNTDDTDWENTIRTEKGSEALTAYQDELLAKDGKYAIVEHSTWIDRVADKFCDKIRKNLAYSAARS